MRAPSAERQNEITLIGTVESALAARKALLVARDLMPEGEDRDEIIGLLVHLRYALTDQGYVFTDENTLFGFPKDSAAA